ncbi:MAG: hypothetical protein P1V20_18475 [Verrucomicrobiales bacterium]|nr:hypothetical protein [Verrucomicrobiales bacterium]
MKNVAIFFGIGCGGLAVLAVVGTFAYFTVVGTIGPDTSVYTGNRVPARFVTTVKDLGLLEEDEKIVWFYSDALTDIRSGLYFATEDKLVLYSKNWDTPENIIPLQEITAVQAAYDDSFFEDSEFFITTRSKEEYSFPLSSDNGLDKRFVEWIEKKIPDR